MADDANDLLEPYGWSAEDDCVLETCCGDAVEYDAPRCPTCGAPNPLFSLGIV